LPIIKRLPRKRGFYNLFRVQYSPVNVGSLSAFDPGVEITPELLYQFGIIDSLTRPVKILAGGELKNAITVKANKFSESAKAKIEAAGGKVEVI
jgi:large subunit ribosomal protein L15